MYSSPRNSNTLSFRHPAAVRRLSLFFILIVLSALTGLGPLPGSGPALLAANPFTGGNPGTIRADPEGDSAAPMDTEGGLNDHGGQLSWRTLPAPLSGGSSRFAQTQFDLRERLADLFGTMKDGPRAGPLLALLGIAFLYGLYHALGPGHRKTIIFTVFLSRKAPWYEPVLAGLLAAFVHALTGLSLVAILSIASGALAQVAETSEAGYLLEYVTFVLLAVVAVLFSVRVLRRLMGRAAPHQHGRGKARSIWGIIVVTSLVPCPGAIMVLLFSLYMGLAFQGVLAVFAMSLGMSIVIAAAGYLAWAGRTGLFYSLKSREGLMERLSAGLELVSWLVMLAFSLWAISPLLSLL